MCSLCVSMHNVHGCIFRGNKSWRHRSTREVLTAEIRSGIRGSRAQEGTEGQKRTKQLFWIFKSLFNSATDYQIFHVRKRIDLTWLGLGFACVCAWSLQTECFRSSFRVTEDLFVSLYRYLYFYIVAQHSHVDNTATILLSSL